MPEKLSWNADGDWRAQGGWGTLGSAGRGFYLKHRQDRLDALRAAHHVPGTTLAVLAGGEIHELAGGVLPEFATPDPTATRAITVRQLLSHTGGVTNDFNHDSGRGDDCLAKYVQAAGDVPLDCPPGTAVSYGGLGYVVLGRLVEVLTGRTWDQALRGWRAQPSAGEDPGVAEERERPDAVRPLPTADGSIAATAGVNGWPPVSGNTRDFAGTGASVADPSEPPHRRENAVADE